MTNQTNASDEKLILKRAARKALHEALQPIFDSIEQRSRTLLAECQRSFERTGFSIPNPDWTEEGTAPDENSTWDAWEVLPHQYVASKLGFLDSLIEDVRHAVECGSLAEIEGAVYVLRSVSNTAFAEVEEFLAGPLSRMKKEQWENLPSWRQWERANEASWVIGSVPMFIGPGDSSSPVLEEAIRALQN